MKGGLYNYRAVSRGGYDGDSCRADLDQGFNVWVKNRELRLYGIDTPELRTRHHIERKLALAAKAVLFEHIPEGQEFILESYRDNSGKYGRVLARIHVEGPSGGWICVNDHLVKTKLAQPYFGKGNRVSWPDWYTQHQDVLDPLLEKYES